jgi:hypothetical protein
MDKVKVAPSAGAYHTWTNHHLHPDQSSDRGLGELHLFLRGAQRHTGSRSNRRSQRLERALVFFAANDNAWASLNRSAPYHLFLERGILERQSILRQRAANDHVHCFLFESGRAFLGEPIGRLFSRSRSNYGTRLADTEVVGERAHLWCGEVRRDLEFGS